MGWLSSALSDVEEPLVERQLVETREKAQGLILSGQVTVDGQKADKPGRTISKEARIEVDDHPSIEIKDTFSGSSYSGGKAPQMLFAQI